MEQLLWRTLEGFGDRTAVVEGDRHYSYHDLVSTVRSIAQDLKSEKVAPHEVVALNGDFSYMSIATLLALFVNRNVVAPIVTLDESSRGALEESCGLERVIRTGSGVEIIPGGGRRTPQASALLERLVGRGASGLVVLSSGMTAAPKVILHDLDALVAEGLRSRGRSRARASRMLMFLLFDHLGGLNSLFAVLRVGGAAVIAPDRTPDAVCAQIDRHGVDVLPTSPTFLNLILMGGYHHRFDLSSLRLVTYGTEPMPEGLLGRVRAAFPQVRLLQTFGTSETGVSSTRSESSTSTYFTFAGPSVRHRVVDGQLELRTNTQLMGYLNSPNGAVDPAGWFRTGDLVEVNEQGFIRVAGRSGDVINVGGKKVLPVEVESALLTSPLVEDCLVYGRPNAITGEAVCVDVKPSRAMPRAELRRELLRFLAKRIDPFKLPARMRLVDSFPVSARFKKERRTP